MKHKKKIVYVDMDGVLCQYKEAMEAQKEFGPYPQSQKGFFLSLAPMDGAVAAYKRLQESLAHRPYILTAPSIKNVHGYSEKRMWVEQYLGMKAAENLIISPHKHLNVGDYLIDDNLKGRGQDKFTGQLIHFGSERFPDWDTVIDYLGVGL